MSSEAESMERDDEDLSCGLLLRDIEEISKALYLHETPRKPLNSSDVAAKAGISRSKSTSLTIQNLSSKDRRSSLWNWRPLKALAHIRNHRFNCCFFLHVHTIEALPPNLNDLSLCVAWNRKNDISRTRPVRARSGTAEFEETLKHRCTVYGSRSGAHGLAKYEPKIFSLRVSAVAPSSELEITNHRIDLSRLLPVTMEELLEADNKKGSSGRWTTSFKLTGEAKGGMLNVSFGFSVLDGNSFNPGCFMKVPDVNNLGSIPRISTDDESELSHSVTLLYRKLDEKKRVNVMDFDRSPESAGVKNVYEFSDADFDVIEQGIEKSGAIETIDIAEIFDGDEIAFDDEFVVESNSKLTHNHGDHEYGSNEEYDPLLDLNNYYEQENHIEPESEKSLISLDDVSESSIENEFLNMLSVDLSHDDDSDDYDLSFPIQAVEKNHDNLNQLLRSRRNAKMLETLETEALMQEWGLTEKAFQYSPHASSGGFGSPVYIPADEPLKLPSIEEGVGPIVRTKDGGFLRSMSPLLFANANNGARLIVQVSAPVVLPPAMGITVMETLRCWACGGVEKMCVQVNNLMPLEDVTGKTMREVLLESECGSNGFNRGALQSSESKESDYVSFEDLVPLAITNIEGLLVQGLKIQSGMPDQEAHSSSESASSLQVITNIDELIKHSLSLDEWIRLDSDEFCDETDSVFVKNFKMGLKVQLRDPFRNYEMVGPSMLALIQVDRVYENKIRGPLFKVSEAHLAGLDVTNGDNKQVWGTSRQQLSGSRWLFSSGMAKSSNANFISNSKAVMKSSKNGLLKKAAPRDVLWSISLPNRGEAASWDERVALNVHVRNPDIIFPNESVM
ncbi:probable WRKY transcription factor 50 [Phtheirospermum japonicum]|uniref:Probable WRKY transcription factor 50 n=1 Tax=Phtheirospermum japonicum TaxID=374723 RepID=A0A830BZR9_9LAMI|nr:probable WRKY transcription factor 50 [Phtheirospermum japonicum]